MTAPDLDTQAPRRAALPARNRTTSVLLMSALLVLVALVYWPGLRGGYVLDDMRNIVANADLHVGADATAEQWRAAALSSPARDLPRPLAMLSFAANHAATGLDPRPMKLTNLALHLLNVLLVFACTRQLVRALPPDRRAGPAREEAFALAVAALWALEPINLMAVLYVVQRMESLAHLFVFAGLWLYLHGRRRQIEGGRGWIPIVLGLVGGSALGTLAKETAVLLPVYALLAEVLVLRGRGADGPQRGLRWFHAGVTVLPAVAAGTWLLLRYAKAHSFAHRDFTLTERLLTEPRVVLDYLQWSVLPSLSSLSLYHDDYVISRSLLDPPATALAMLGIVALVAAAVMLRARRPLLALGVAWFLAAQTMTATFIPLELMYEHRNYFASFGVCLALADVLLRLPATDTARRGGLLVAALFAVVFAGTTYLRATEWENPLRFADSEARKHPRSPRATYALAAKLVGLTGYKADSPYDPAARAAIERAIAASGDSVMPEQAALIYAARTGRPLDPAWWDGVADGLRKAPGNAGNVGALAALGNCAIEGACRFPRERMVEIHLAALEKQPSSGVLSYYGRYALLGLRDPALALRVWEEAVARSPRNAQNRINLARLLLALGRDAEARVQLDELKRLDRFGKYATVVDELEAALANPDAARATPPDQPAR